MLQILDEGHVKDAKGRLVNFKNTVIILTSNIGSQMILNLNKHGEFGFDIGSAKSAKAKEKNMREKIMGTLHEHFKPEFLNRLDEIIIFHSLNEKQVAQIVELQLVKIKTRLQEKKITLEIDPTVKKHIATVGYEPTYGARPIKRVIQNEILDELSLQIIDGKIKDGQAVNLQMEKGKIVFK